MKYVTDRSPKCLVHQSKAKLSYLSRIPSIRPVHVPPVHCHCGADRKSSAHTCSTGRFKSGIRYCGTCGLYAARECSEVLYSQFETMIRVPIQESFSLYRCAIVRRVSAYWGGELCNVLIQSPYTGRQ